MAVPFALEFEQQLPQRVTDLLHALAEILVVRVAVHADRAFVRQHAIHRVVDALHRLEIVPE